MDTQKDIVKKQSEVNQKLRRKEMINRALEVLSHGIVGSLELAMACSPGGKYQKISTIERRHQKIRDFFEHERDLQRFYSFLFFLQKSGLVVKEKKEKGGVFFWSLTKKGRVKHASVRSAVDVWLFPPALYQPEPSATLTIVIFDISEKERSKREWLRRALQNMKFSMVQKSVWTGMCHLPPQFIYDLKTLDLMPCVKIFSAVELGNL